MGAPAVSARRRDEIIAALRRGTVPAHGLDQLAVGLERFQGALAEDLDRVAEGGFAVKVVRGEYGSGKTFFTRHLTEQALQRGFAAAEVQISETETPLHRLETVYRRITESLRTASVQPSAFRSVLDSWLFALEDDALLADPTLEGDPARLAETVTALLNERLAAVSTRTPAFAQALRGYHATTVAGDAPLADGLAAWLAGQPHVAASAKRAADIKGDLDHFGAMSFLQGLLAVLRDAGHPGLVVVLDEVETLQRMRSDVRDKALNALRQLMDEIDAGRYPGLYLVLTGTPAFFDGPSGVQRLPPLAQRLATDFTTDARFDNPRAVQIRLTGFSRSSLVQVGSRVRNLYAVGRDTAGRIHARADDAYLADLAGAVTGGLGDRVGIAPRLFLKKLIGDVLDRIDLFDDFDPRRDYRLTVTPAEWTEADGARGGAAAAVGDGAGGTWSPRAAADADDVDLDV